MRPTPLFHGIGWVPPLLALALGVAVARAWLFGTNLSVTTVAVLVAMVCYWEAQINNGWPGWPKLFDAGPELRARYWQAIRRHPLPRALLSAALLCFAAFPLAAAGVFIYSKLPVSPGKMSELMQVAAPLQAQVEKRAQAGLPAGQWGSGLTVPQSGAVEGTINETGDILLVRPMPPKLIVLNPIPKRRSNGSIVLRWECRGAPLEDVPAGCAPR
jgi:hypothetical protein